MTKHTTVVLLLCWYALLTPPSGWFTGLTPQLVDESFTTDLEQRYEQGQHLHTKDCSSSAISICGSSCTRLPITIPSARAVESISIAAVPPALYCRSFCAAGASGTAAAGSTAAVAAAAGLAGAGGRICLRLHVLARGLEALKLTGGESVSACLERLRDNVEQMRRHKDTAAVQDEVRPHTWQARWRVPELLRTSGGTVGESLTQVTFLAGRTSLRDTGPVVRAHDKCVSNVDMQVPLKR